MFPQANQLASPLTIGIEATFQMRQDAGNEYPKASKWLNVWIDLSIVAIVFTLSVAAFWIFRSH